MQLTTRQKEKLLEFILPVKLGVFEFLKMYEMTF